MIILKYWKEALLVVMALLIAYLVHDNIQQVHQKQNAQQIIDKMAAPKLIVTKGSDSLWTAQIATITATTENLGYLLGESKATIQDQTGKISRLQNLIQTGFEASGSFTTHLRDSVIVHDSLHIDHLGVFNFADGYIRQGCQILNGNVQCQYTYTDSVTATVYMRKQWKWWQLGKQLKLRRQGKNRFESTTEIKFGNPNAKATNVRSIIVEK